MNRATAHLVTLCLVAGCGSGDSERSSALADSTAGVRVDSAVTVVDAGPWIDIETMVAVVSTDAAGTACLWRGDIAAGTRLLLVSSAQPQRVMGAVVGAATGGPCPFEIEAQPESVSRAVVTADAPLDARDIHFALIDRGFEVIAPDGVARGDLDGDGQEETFRACTSMEGLHLSIWSGSPGSGTRRWHRYLYLGYDVEATCTGADFVESVDTAAQAPAGMPSPPAVPDARIPDGPFEGIYSWIDRWSAPLGIGRLRPVGDPVRSVPGGWTAGISVPLYDAPGGTLTGWIHGGWLINESDRRPFQLGGMVETEYEDLSFIVSEVREDGWLRFRYGSPSEPGAGLAWVHRDQLAIGAVALAYEPWEERFTSDEIGPLHLRGAGPWTLHQSPDPVSAQVARIGRDHHLEPLEFRDEWLRVRVTEPSDYCAGEPIEVNVTEGWIRWRDAERGALVWYATRGC